MKQYLMTGIAAVAMCAAFTSCSHDYGFEQMTQEELTQQKYNQAFLNYIGGPIDPNQDWGFSATRGVTRGITRSNPGVNYPQTEAYHNMNHNEWADPDKGFGGWLVPDALTEGQKLRVRKYFQANPDLSYEDPHYRHFFVQQVYKGGTAREGVSQENIVAADNSTYTSSNMNLLSVGQSNIHINDFNSGTCSQSDVLDNGQHVGGTTHKDQITLMVNIDDTSCFGYHETGSSTQHNNKAALVSAATIDAWAASNGNPGEAVTDKWNRSFMGFDLALKEGAQAQSNVAAKYNDGPESYSYAKVNNEIVSINGNDNIVFNGKTVYYIDTNKNHYVAEEQIYVSDGELQAEYRVNGQYMGKYLNVDKIMQLLADGYLPIKDKNLREWVKVGTSDGYFTDWIVTLTEAQRNDGGGGGGGDDDEYDLKIIAEDLSATDASDFDFNDIVLEVKYGSPAKVKLTHAGGTLPLRINGNDDLEVHKLFNVKVNQMVNTGKGPSRAPVLLHNNGLSVNIENAADADLQLTLEVYKNGSWQTMTAPIGEPACKLAVGMSFQVLKERQSIKGACPLFVQWAQDANFTSQWW